MTEHILTVEQRVAALEEESERLWNLIEELKENSPAAALWNARSRDREHSDSAIEELERKIRNLEAEHRRKLDDLHHQLCALQGRRAYASW